MKTAILSSARGRALGWCTRLVACVLVAVTASCVTSRNYMVCSEIREDCRFCGFDTAYVSARSLKDKWVLDSLRSAGLTGLSDTLVICIYDRQRFFPPKHTRICVRSDSTYYDVWLQSWYTPQVKRSVRPSGESEGARRRFVSFETSLLLAFDMENIRRLLEVCPSEKRVTCRLIRAVTDGDRIKRWDEYKFADIGYCDRVKEYLDSLRGPDTRRRPSDGPAFRIP